MARSNRRSRLLSATLFAAQDFENLTVEKLIGPLVSAKTLSTVRTHMTHFLQLGHGETGELGSALDVEVKLTNADGSFLQRPTISFDSAPSKSRRSRVLGWCASAILPRRTQLHRELETCGSRC